MLTWRTFPQWKSSLKEGGHLHCCEGKVASELGLEGLLGFEQFGKQYRVMWMKVVKNRNNITQANM